MAEAPVLTNLVNLQNETTAVTAINANNAAISTAFEDVLSLSGTALNQMQSNLDMNSNHILNLPAPASNNEPLRLIDGLASGGIQGPRGVTGPQGIPGVIQGITGTSGISITGTSSNPIINNTTIQGQANNFLPNTQYQLWSGTGQVGITKFNSNGVSQQTPITATGYDTNNATVRFFTSNTQSIRVGDVVVISGGSTAYNWGYSGIGYVSTATGVRVVAVSPGVSITVQSNFGGISPPTSVSGCIVTPITAGALGSAGTGVCNDGWKKATTLTVQADDWANNAYPGALRTLGCNKGSTSSEIITWSPATAQMKRYAGRTISFGIAINQTVQNSSGTARIFIEDNVSGITYSSSATGVSFGGYQFLSVTATVSPTATALFIGISLDGTTNDGYYIALPTAIFGSSITVNQLGSPPEEIARPVGHWNPPLLTPLTITFPTSTTVGQYGWTGLDLEAISLCVVHNSVFAVKCKIEWLTSTAGAYIITGSALNASSLVFGPQTVTVVAGINNVDSGWLPLADGGTFAIFTPTSGLIPTTGTFDFDLVQLSGRWSTN